MVTGILGLILLFSDVQIHIVWLSLLGRQRERQACLLPRRFSREDGLSIFSSGISLGYPKSITTWSILCNCQAFLSQSERARQKIWIDIRYDQSQRLLAPVVNLRVRYPTRLRGSFPLTLTFKDSGLSGIVCPDRGDSNAQMASDDDRSSFFLVHCFQTNPQYPTTHTSMFL